MNRLATLLVLTLFAGACTEAGPIEANPDTPALAVLADGGPSFSPWSPAAAVGSPITTPNYWEACPFIAKDGLNLFFRKEINHPPFGWRWEIFVSHRETVEDPWGDPVNLGANINPGPSHQRCSLRHDRWALALLRERPYGPGLVRWLQPLRLDPAHHGRCMVDSREPGTRHQLVHVRRPAVPVPGPHHRLLLDQSGMVRGWRLL
jgi:hypothetical protein